MFTASTKLSFPDRAVIAALFLALASTAAQKSLHAMKVAERRKVNSISAEYSQLRSMYSVQQGRGDSSVH